MMDRALRVAEAFVLFVVAIAVRLLSWHSVFQRDGVYPNGNDAYYHFRRIRYSIDHFPEVLRFDPLMNFPEGAQPIWSPTVDWTIAAVLRFVPGIDQPDLLERIVVWMPPLLGAATVVLLYFVALHFYSRTVAIIASVALAILPAHSLYSRLGAVDHHVVVAAVATLMLAITMQLFRDAVSGDSDARAFVLSGVLGVTIALAVAIWPGCLLHVGVLEVAMILRLVSTSTKDEAVGWARRFALVHLIACLTIYPLAVGNEWVLWGSLSPVVLSDFQPLFFIASAACFGLLAVIWPLGWAASNRSLRTISMCALGTVVLSGMLSTIPELRIGLTDAVSWLGKDEEFQSIVSESAPLFSGPAASARAMMFLSPFVFVVPFSILCLGWKFRRQADQLLFLWWASAFFALTLMQWRFMNTYSIAHCLLIAIASTTIYDALRPHLVSRIRAGGAFLGALTLVMYALFLPLNGYRPHLDNWGRSLRGQETPPVGLQLHARFVADAARFLRDHSPELGQSPYSVLGPWGDGHLLKYISERPVVQDNFGDDVAPVNFQRAEAYFAARKESEALEILAPMNTRYVLVRSTGSGHSPGYAPDSLFTRLYQMKGSGGRSRGHDAQRLPGVRPLQQHRLIYQSAPLRANATAPYCTLFEVVSGAKLVGRADPGTLVEVSLTIEPRVGRAFKYIVRERADATGEYSVRLPYSNEAFSPDVRTAAHYTVRAGARSATVMIPEAAVQSGTRVEGPTLEN